MLTGNPKTDPDLFVGHDHKGSTFIYKDGTVAIYDPNSTDRGTVFKPDNGFDYFLRAAKGGAPGAEAPVISAPPAVPPVLDHPSVAPLPVQPGHPLAPPAPIQIVDPATLPPWLQNSSPPGFQVAPSQSPPIFGLGRSRSAASYRARVDNHVCARQPRHYLAVAAGRR
jgi:hypothetical protein